MRFLFTMGSPRAGCVRCCSFANVAVVSSEVVHTVNAFACAVDAFNDGRWRLSVRRFGTLRLCVGFFFNAIPHAIADVFHQCKKSHMRGFRY